MSIFKPVYNNIKYPQPSASQYPAPGYGYYAAAGAGYAPTGPASPSPAGGVAAALGPKLPSFSELVTSIPLPNEFPLNRPSSNSPPPPQQSSTNLYYYSTTPVRQASTSSLNSSTVASTSLSPKTLLPTPPPTNISNKDTKRKHVCKVCSRSFTTSGHLARHNRIHTGERKHLCPWPSCDARFARQDNCMQHYKTHTNGKKRKNLSSRSRDRS